MGWYIYFFVLSLFMKTTIKIKGMHCASCETLIKEGIEELPGIKSVKVSRKTNTSEIEYDENKVSIEKIKSRIKKEGYEAI